MFQNIRDLQRVLVGFDRIFNEQVNTSNYPPYNLVKIDDETYIVELAVAGFNKGEIDIEVNKNRLTITGKKTVADTEGQYVHKGIASRDFQQSFVLAEHMVVKTANFENGILRINLVQVIPEELKPRKVDIS